MSDIIITKGGFYLPEFAALFRYFPCITASGTHVHGITSRADKALFGATPIDLKRAFGEPVHGQVTITCSRCVRSMQAQMREMRRVLDKQNASTLHHLSQGHKRYRVSKDSR